MVCSLLCGGAGSECVEDATHVAVGLPDRRETLKFWTRLQLKYDISRLTKHYHNLTTKIVEKNLTYL